MEKQSCPDCEKLLSMMNSEIKHNRQEVLNMLGSKLRVEYRDFMSVKDVEEIDPILALNFRDQLASIFKTLERNGVKF